MSDHLRFVLQRDTDVTGVSGTGVVAQGVWWPDGDVVALRWTSEWPTSVVFHDRGIESVEAIHGHGGATRIVWLDLPVAYPEVHEDLCPLGCGQLRPAPGTLHMCPNYDATEPTPDDAARPSGG